MPAATISNEQSVIHQLRKTLEIGSTSHVIKSFVRALRASSDKYNWVGVYLVRGDNLVLEAYEGDAETEHVSIPIGQGICGSAAKMGKTMVVPDVSKDSRYLMCFPSTRSEIVVPIKARKGVIGEIDIDSDKLAAFKPSDQKLLERIAEQLANYLEQKQEYEQS